MRLQITRNLNKAQNLYQAIPKIFPRKIDWAKVHQHNQRPGETIFDYFKRFEKTYKQHSGIDPENSLNHQNDPILNFIFLEGLDEELSRLVKRHELYGTSLVVQW